MISRATLADELLFQSLPIETQEAIKRLFYNPNEYSAEDMDECERHSWELGYESGYDKGFDAGKCEIAAMF